MIFILGGAYQGKLEYATTKYGLKPEDVLDLESEEQDFSKKCLYHFEAYLREKYHQGLRLCDSEIRELSGKIIIMDDITGGIVPMDPEERLYREYCGRTMVALGEAAGEVYRIFCGFETRLK